MHTGLYHTAYTAHAFHLGTDTVRNVWAIALHPFWGVNTAKLVHSLLHSSDSTDNILKCHLNIAVLEAVSTSTLHT